MPFALLVLDASAALALVLAEEEGTKVASAVERTIHANGQIFVPALFWYELGNCLLCAERRKRLSRLELSAAEGHFCRLPIVTDGIGSPEARERTYELARRHRLSYYDASYLELALRQQARLASCDAHLMALQASYPRLFA